MKTEMIPLNRLRIEMEKKMKRTITKTLCIKSMVTWLVVAFVCILSLNVFIRKLMESFANQEEIFIPGIAVLFGVVILLLFFSGKQIIKYIRLIKN